MVDEKTLEVDEEQQEDSVAAALKPGYCQLPGCGRKLSMYNRTGFCLSAHDMEEIEAFKAEYRVLAKANKRADITPDILLAIVKRVVRPADEKVSKEIALYLLDVDTNVIQEEASAFLGYARSSASHLLKRFKRRLTENPVLQDQLSAIRELYPPKASS